MNPPRRESYEVLKSFNPALTWEAYCRIWEGVCQPNPADILLEEEEAKVAAALEALNTGEALAEMEARWLAKLAAEDEGYSLKEVDVYEWLKDKFPCLFPYVTPARLLAHKKKVDPTYVVLDEAELKAAISVAIDCIQAQHAQDNQWFRRN